MPTGDGGSLRLLTHGPEQPTPDQSIVMVCGAFLPASVYTPFALMLRRRMSPEWTIHVHDRRGKGASSPIPEGYSLDTEVEDTAAVLRHTGARYLLGHSLGGSIALHTVRALSGADGSPLRDTALVPTGTMVYDPAINLEGSLDASWLDTFEAHVDSGHYGRALDLADRWFGATPTLSKAPTWMAAGVLALTLRTGVGRFGREVFPAAVAELSAALRRQATPSDFAGLPTGTLFMVGERSAEYFHATTQALADAVPGAVMKVLPKGLHGSIPAVRHDVVGGVAAWLGESENPPGTRTEHPGPERPRSARA